MKICGLQKLTLLDYPGNIACTVFLGGCNFKCPYCYNSSLINLNDCKVFMSEDELLSFLDLRKGKLKGVAITGGEPLINPDIKDLIIKIRNKGYQVKLDTNGSFPDRLKELIDNKLLDYVAMDIKNSYDKYNFTTGVHADIIKIKQSIELLLSNKVDYEFRTTVIQEFHEVEDFKVIGQMIKGAKNYFIQSFQDKDSVCGSFNPMSKEQLLLCLENVKEYVPNAKIRGID